MGDCEHVLFFPVIVLVALILIALSFRLLFRFLLLFLVVIAIWYGLHFLGITSPPVDKAQKIQSPQPHKKDAFAHV